MVHATPVAFVIFAWKTWLAPRAPLEPRRISSLQTWWDRHSACRDFCHGLPGAWRRAKRPPCQYIMGIRVAAPLHHRTFSSFAGRCRGQRESHRHSPVQSGRQGGRDRLRRARCNPAWSSRAGQIRESSAWGDTGNGDTTFPHTLNLCDWLYAAAPYDRIWGHYLAPAGFFAAWLGRLKGTPSIVSIRGNDLDRDMFPPGDFARLRWTLDYATVVTAVSEELSRKVTALAGHAKTFTVHLPNSVDHEAFRPEPVPAGLREQLRHSTGRTGAWFLRYEHAREEGPARDSRCAAAECVRSGQPAC